MNHQLTLSIVDSDEILLCNVDRKLEAGWWVLFWEVAKGPTITLYKCREGVVLGCVVGGWPTLPTIDYGITLPATPKRDVVKFGTIWTDTTKYETEYCYGVDHRSRFIYHGHRVDIERQMQETFTEDFIAQVEAEMG